MQQPRAVIALPNNIQIDARAHRNALALVAAGYEVTMVGYGTGLPPQGVISGVPHVLCSPQTIAAAAAPTASKRPTVTYRVVRKAMHVTMRRRPPLRVQKAVARFDETIDAAARGVRGVGRKVAKSITDAGAARKAVEAVEAVDETPRTWRDMLPQVPRMTATLKPVLLELRPDVIVTDVHLLPVATEVAEQLGAQGHHVGVVYDAREYVYGLASEDPNVTEGFPALEAEFMPKVDATFTVCEPIAEFLQEHYNLPTTPKLVPNAPIGDLPPVARPMTIRDFLDVPADAPVLAYAGGLSWHRGIHDVVSALPDLPGVHFAIGTRRSSSYILELERQAEKLGVRDRVHFVPFAPTHEVAEYLASATAAIFPFLPVGNHDWAAPNKYFESIQARLPIITSNMSWLSARVTELGVGEVFEHSNPGSVVEAVRKVLDDPEKYRSRITDEVVEAHCFEAFLPVVQEVCTSVTLQRLLAGLAPSSLSTQLRAIRRDMLTQRASLADADIFEPRPWLRIGNANTGGQPREWSSALMREHPEAISESVWLVRETPFPFPVDESITYPQWVSPAWQRALTRKLEDRVTHVLTESSRATVGARFGKFFYEELDWFAQKGITLGLVFHGSDIRDPRRHASQEADSPFSDPDEELTATLQRQVDAITPHVAAFDGPKFVTTNDLLDYVPDATWLPVVVDTDAWSSDIVPLQRSGAPKVLHVPSRGSFKGSPVVDEVCERLQAQGRIRYIRDEGLAREEMRRRVLDADILVDQLRLGDYGITAVEGMSAGKVVLGHVADRVRARIDGDLPILEADRDTFESVLVGILDDPERAADLGRAGRAYVERWHDGTHAATVLADFMGLDPRP